MLSAAVMCLAMNMYHEARSEGIQGMMAVAEVTMNRVESDKFPDNVCEVVEQGYHKGKHRCQFSWYCDGKSDKMRDERWRLTAEELAIDYLTGFDSNFTQGATFYHASYVKPYWAKHFEKTTQIGTHIFYKE